MAPPMIMTAGIAIINMNMRMVIAVARDFLPADPLFSQKPGINWFQDDHQGNRQQDCPGKLPDKDQSQDCQDRNHAKRRSVDFLFHTILMSTCWRVGNIRAFQRMGIKVPQLLEHLMARKTRYGMGNHFSGLSCALRIQLLCIFKSLVSRHAEFIRRHENVFLPDQLEQARALQLG